MKIQVRRNVFETNSSSTHSLTICEEKFYDGWKNGEYAFDEYRQIFIKVEFVLNPLENMTDEEEIKVIENFRDNNHNWYTNWSKLSDQDKLEWYKDYQIKEYYGSQYETYYVWLYNSYGLSNRGEIVTPYTSPKGEKLIAFGYYGYDG